MNQPIFIVDDDQAVRDSLRVLLESAGHVVRTYASARKFLSDAQLDQGCLIVDCRMPEMSGLELQEELSRRGENIPVIVITGHGDVPLAVRAMTAGALDFIEKPFDGQRLLDSLARALEIGHQKRSRAAEAKAAQALLAQLTARERQVFDKLIKGNPNKIVAFELGISPRTVEVHRSKIMFKLHARSLSDLVRNSLAAG